MLVELVGYPANVIAVRGTGTITADDYRGVLEPAIARAAETGRPVRMLLIFGEDFEGYASSALLADAALGARNWRGFERIALVTDADWLQTAVSMLAPLIPGEVRVRATRDLPEADLWIRSPDSA
jgi:hypothetical protein